MWRSVGWLAAAVCFAPVPDARGVIIDRIAVIVGKRVVKDSDIVRDIRVTSFLNREQPDFSLSSRKRAASRLIDQEVIRAQIQSGGYPIATSAEVSNLLAQIKKDRFKTDADYRTALAHYGISDAQLNDALMWELTVLHFIDARFRPAVMVTQEEIASYYQMHRAALEAAHPKAKTFEELVPVIREQLSGEQINQMFDEWLKQTRADTVIEYREKSLA